MSIYLYIMQEICTCGVRFMFVFIKSLSHSKYSLDFPKGSAKQDGLQGGVNFGLAKG